MPGDHQGSSTILLLTQDGIIAARDKLGRLPVLVRTE